MTLVKTRLGTTDQAKDARFQPGGSLASTNVQDAIEEAASEGMLKSTYDPAGVAEQLVGRTATQTLTDKTLTSPTVTAPDIDGGTADGLTSFGIRSTGSGAFDFQIQNTENLTAARALIVNLNDAGRTLTLQGNPTLDDWFDQSVKQAASPTFAGATINGNISVTGTVDGRDVSDDGTKLDFITVTQAVDLDSIETRVNDLDAAIILRGTWDASTGSFPGGGMAQAGDSYIVSTGGTVDSVEFVADDRLIAITDNASTSTFAGNWHKADYSDLVQSVAGLTGTISASGLRTAADLNSATELASTSNGEGASRIGIEDAGGIITATTVEAALAEIQGDLDAVEADYAVESDVEVASINAQTDTAHTLALTDRGQVVTMDNGSANTVTIPTNASVAFDIGTVIHVIQKGSGTTTITGDTGVTLNGASAGSGDIQTQFQGVSLLKVASDTWIASGDIGTVS